MFLLLCTLVYCACSPLLLCNKNLTNIVKLVYLIQMNIFKSFSLITISILFLTSCENPRLPEEFKYKMYKYDEVDCSGKTKKCLKTADGMLFFIDEGYLFRLDPQYKDRYAHAEENWTGIKGVKELLPYRDLLLGLTDSRELYLANEKKQFVRIGQNIDAVEVDGNDIIVVKRIVKSYATFNMIQIFDSEEHDPNFVYFGPLSQQPPTIYSGTLTSFEGFYDLNNGNRPLVVDSTIYSIIGSEPIKLERTSEGELFIKHGRVSISYEELKSGVKK